MSPRGEWTLHHTEVRARTPKICSRCRGTLAAGEVYYRWAASIGEDPQRFDVRLVECAACYGAEEAETPGFTPSPRPVQVTPANRAEAAGEVLRYITLPRTNTVHLAEVQLGDGAWLAVRPICRTVRDREWSYREQGGGLELYRWINTYAGEAPGVASAVPGEDLLGKSWDHPSACPRCITGYRRLYAEWRRAQSAEVREVEDLL